MQSVMHIYLQSQSVVATAASRKVLVPKTQTTSNNNNSKSNKKEIVRNAFVCCGYEVYFFRVLCWQQVHVTLSTFNGARVFLNIVDPQQQQEALVGTTTTTTAKAT